MSLFGRWLNPETATYPLLSADSGFRYPRTTHYHSLAKSSALFWDLEESENRTVSDLMFYSSINCSLRLELPPESRRTGRRVAGRIRSSGGNSSGSGGPAGSCPASGWSGSVPRSSVLSTHFLSPDRDAESNGAVLLDLPRSFYSSMINIFYYKYCIIVREND